jgi:hypothetical protein
VTRRLRGIYRPDLTSHYEMISEIRDAVNRDALFLLSDTDIVKIAVEKMFIRVYPKKSVVSKRRKMYIRLNS